MMYLKSFIAGVGFAAFSIFLYATLLRASLHLTVPTCGPQEICFEWVDYSPVIPRGICLIAFLVGFYWMLRRTSKQISK
jgi:hypothetical protein